MPEPSKHLISALLCLEDQCYFPQWATPQLGELKVKIDMVFSWELGDKACSFAEKRNNGEKCPDTVSLITKTKAMSLVHIDIDWILPLVSVKTRNFMKLKHLLTSIRNEFQAVIGPKATARRFLHSSYVTVNYMFLYVFYILSIHNFVGCSFNIILN
jgi:hypothetical protein